EGHRDRPILLRDAFLGHRDMAAEIAQRQSEGRLWWWGRLCLRLRRPGADDLGKQHRPGQQQSREAQEEARMRCHDGCSFMVIDSLEIRGRPGWKPDGSAREWEKTLAYASGFPSGP